MGNAPQPQSASPGKRRYLLLLLLPLLIAAVGPTVSDHFRAASLLLRIQNPKDSSGLAHYHTYAVTESPADLVTPHAKVRARFYRPVGASHPSAMVVVHGVHHLGVEEPRLMAFSRALAATGIQVFTPELPDIADYHISHDSVDVIGAAAQEFSKQVGHPVGVLGLSFAGGEALLAAADPHYSNNISFVVSIGAHEDMHRVADFFITGKIARPDGTIATLKPHEYGPLVLMYSHLDEFFPRQDLPSATDAMRLLLWEEVEPSRLSARSLSTPSQQMMSHLYDHDSSGVAEPLRKAITKHAGEMAAVSPHGQLGSLHVPVLLLHGAGDDVIPATEMLWLEQDIPSDYLRGALATPLLTHVSVAGEPPLREKIALVNFMSKLIQLADASRQQRLGQPD